MKAYYSLFSIILFSLATNASPQDPWDFYDARYNLPDIYQSLTDNKGLGSEEVYGTRNFRKLLNGIVFRGGANNKYHRETPRDNLNPLQESALQTLCREGFSSAIYLYKMNFETASPETTCTDIHGRPNTLKYYQRSPNTQPEDILKLVHAHLSSPENGPIYLHCWNGWHMSGLASAYTLMQFCGWTNQKAVEYWDRNTDGRNQEPQYEKIRNRIRNFKTLPDLKISKKIYEKVCPVN